MALEDGFEPPTRTPSTCRSTSELLQQLDPTPGIEPGPGGSANRRLPTWQGRVVWHQGKELNPHFVVQSHVPYLLDHPGVLRHGALDGDRTRHLLLDRQSSPPGNPEGATKKRGGCAPGRIRTSIAAGHGVTARWARLCPSRRVFHHACLACHAYSVFKVRTRILRAKRKGPGVARPLVDSFVIRESSNHSHRGDSGPSDARVGSCPRTMRVLAGYRRAGRRPQPALRLRIPRSSFCLWLSWLAEHIARHDDLSSCQIDSSRY
jgi:hypothetical protein